MILKNRKQYFFLKVTARTLFFAKIYLFLYFFYKQYHGTETALLPVNNDILTAIDNGKITVLILLDLSAAFDTVDHNTLYSHLWTSWLSWILGIQDQALNWCKSYLSNRPQYVRIGTATSHPTVLDYSVPQGSVLGPQWFTVYTYPVRDIILRHNLNYHVYADDTQLYYHLIRPSNTQTLL